MAAIDQFAYRGRRPALARPARLLVSSLVVGLLVTLLPGPAPKAWAAVSLDSFVATYTDKRVSDPKGGYVGECVSLVKRYHTEVVGGTNFDIQSLTSPSGAAFGMWTAFSKIPQLTAKYQQVSATSAARRGDIAVFNATSTNAYGHVAIVLADAASNATTLRVFEQNSPKGAAATTTTNKSKTALLGYLRPAAGMTYNNVAAVLSDGRLVAKQGGLGTSWLNMTSGISQVKISGNNVAALTTGGTLLGKQGGFATGWMTLTSGVKSFDLC